SWPRPTGRNPLPDRHRLGEVRFHQPPAPRGSHSQNHHLPGPHLLRLDRPRGALTPEVAQDRELRDGSPPAIHQLIWEGALPNSERSRPAQPCEIAPDRFPETHRSLAGVRPFHRPLPCRSHVKTPCSWYAARNAAGPRRVKATCMLRDESGKTAGSPWLAPALPRFHSPGRAACHTS